MKNKVIFGLVLIMLVGIMIGYNFFNSDYGGKFYVPDDIRQTLTPGEKHYLSKKEKIRIGISDQLAPFVQSVGNNTGNQGQNKDSATAYDGLLVELMDLILSQIGETGEYVFLPQTQLETNLKSGFIDSAIMVYDKNALDRLRFTNPLIPTKGKVFVYRAGAGPVQTIDTRKVPSVEETVKGVLSKKTEDGDSGEIRLLGNEGALNYFVKKHGNIEEFTIESTYAFEDNFCIAVDKNQKNLYEIMNKAVYKIDKNEVLSQLEGKWLGVSYPLENRGITESIGILFVIILTAVMAAFYIFYGSNKTLYEELATRMEQVLESKNELQTTFDGVSYYMIEIDLAGKILNGNKAFYKSLETDGSTVIGKELTQVLHFEGEKKKELNELIQYSIKTEEEQKRELSAVRKIYNTRIFPLKNTKGKVIKVLVTIQDITNEKTMERQMIQDNKMIAVGQLAAGVAHEIRNPLGLIRNYCYVLKNNDEQKEKAISVIEKAVDKSGRIIDNLLNFSRSTNHQWENITLEAHIHAILSLQRNRALKEGIDLEIKCPYGLQVFVLVESLDMILINLTSNAMDAITGTSQEEHGKIIIACSENDEKVVLKIRDNGEGIPEEIKEEIFNPFFTTKEKRDGNGLGLYIVYNEIQKMNGKIFVESQVAKGTEFTVEIPKWEGVNHGA